MENFKKDLDSSSFRSSAEIQFLEQVKECRHHLHCMEKLLFELQQTPASGSEKEIKSDSSMIDCNQEFNKMSNSSSSFPDLQSLMQEFENKINSKMTMDSDSINTPKKESIQINLHTVSNDNTCSPLTFVMQVPNNIFNLLNKSNPNGQSTNFSHHSSETKLCKPRRHKRLTLLLNKLFKRKKSNSLPTITISTNLLENLELLKIKRDESITNSSHSSNTNNLNYKSILKDEQRHSTDKNSLSDNSVHAGMDYKFGDSKNKATVIIPITYNFDEKFSTTITPNLTVQLETNPQLTTCSNCVKITNEVPVSSSTLEKEMKKSKMEIHSKADVQPPDILLETLIKTLFKTTERLEHLETLKTVTENLSKKELKLEKGHCCHNNCKINDNAKSKTSDYLTQYFVNDTRNKTSESRQEKKKKQQIPKRQSSKLSICSSSDSISSDEEPFRNSGILRPQHIQRHKRCHSPSMLNYLVCQSERDIDQK